MRVNNKHPKREKGRERKREREKEREREKGRDREREMILGRNKVQKYRDYWRKRKVLKRKDECTLSKASWWISSWTPLKPQHSNPNSNPNPLANQLWCIDFLTSPTPLIIPHRLPAFLESLMPLKKWCSIHARWSNSSVKHSIRFCDMFSKFKTEFYCISFF